MNHKQFFAIIILTFLCAFSTNAQIIEQAVKLQPPKQGESLFRYVPFEVPQNTKSLSISFDFDKKGGANGLNFGLFETGFTGKDSDKNGFRGYSGYVRDSIFIAEDKATHGYRAGKISAGKWFVLVGLSKIAPEGVELKLKIKFNQIDEKALKQFETEKSKIFTHEKNEKPNTIKLNGLTWFRGDLHAHGVHGDGSWTVKGILDSAVSNGLDFVALTEHNTYTHHYEINAEKKNYPNMLIIRGEEVTTYGAHINVWGLPTEKWVDFRVLPGLQASGKQIAKQAHQFGGLASINHPTMNCGGCNWTYGDDWGIMDSVEIWNATWDSDDE
ncbi:MAG: CehA/McbA family metallohydrolase, partial [Acidobacteriota bacterium]